MVKALQHLITLALRDKTIDDKTRQQMIADHNRRLATYAYAAKFIVSHEFPAQIQERKEPTMYGYGLTFPATSSNPVGASWPSA